MSYVPIFHSLLQNLSYNSITVQHALNEHEHANNEFVGITKLYLPTVFSYLVQLNVYAFY